MGGVVHDRREDGAPSGQREGVSGAGRRDARYGGDPDHQLVVEAGEGLRIPVAVRGQGKMEGEDPFRIEVGIHGAEFLEAPDHQRRSHEEDECQRDLRDDEGVSHRVLRPPDRPAAAPVPKGEEHSGGADATTARVPRWARRTPSAPPARPRRIRRGGAPGVAHRLVPERTDDGVPAEMKPPVNQVGS